MLNITPNKSIEWFMNKAECFLDETEVYNGDTVRCISHQFTGNIPYVMLVSAREWFKKNGTTRDTRRGLVYSADTDNGSISMMTGGTKSTEKRVNVVFNEYIIIETPDEYNAEWLAYLA